MLPEAVAVEAWGPERVAVREEGAVEGAGAEVAAEEVEGVDVVVGEVLDTKLMTCESKREVLHPSRQGGWARLGFLSG